MMISSKCLGATTCKILLLSCLLVVVIAFSPTTRQPYQFNSRSSALQNAWPATSLHVTTNVKEDGIHDQTEQQQGQDHDGNQQEYQLDEEVVIEDDDIKTYETNLELGKLASRCARRGRQARLLAMSAYDLLQNMTYPDTVAYNSVLKAFAKSSPTKIPNVVNRDGTTGPWVTAAERAQGLLEEMIAQHEAQATASHTWYVQNAQGQLTQNELDAGPPRIRVKPNVRSFSTVMDAWSRTGNVAATLQVLQSLERRYEESDKDVALQPNIFCYNTVLAAYSKSKGGITGAEEAEQFLQTMPVEPDVISYNAVLHAWARSGHRYAGEHASAILRTMTVPPNSRTYTTVMDAWSRSRPNSGSSSSSTGSTISPALMAHELLEELKELYETTGEEQLKPNCVTYSTVINAYALSKEPQKAQKAYELLQEMIVRGQKDPQVLPNTVTYNSVLNAAATSSPLTTTASTTTSTSSQTYKEESDDVSSGNCNKKSNNGEVCLQNIVQTLYHQLTSQEGNSNNNNNDNNNNDNDKNNTEKKKQQRQRLQQLSLEPDHFTFGTVLKACANNIFWDDPTFGMYVFEEACRRGQVSLGVLVQLRQAVPMHIFQDFLPPNAYDSRTRQFSMSNIPDSWKRNVRERKYN